MGKNRSSWNQHTCLACGETFAVMAEGDPIADYVCRTCIQDFGIETDEDVKEMLDMFGFTGNNNHHGHVQNVTTPPKPKVDPKAVAAGIRAQIDYKVAPVSRYDKPITYLCAKNGLFEVRHSDLATVIVKPKEILGVTEEMKEGVTLNLPRVPYLFLQQTVSFFRGVEAKMNHSSEALVQIWWNRETKLHEMHVPEQRVSGGSVNHTSVFDLDSSGKYFHVMDIHSHGSNMSAFWSGTDNADEARVTTDRMFGVIGKVKDPIPMWKWRMRTRDGFIDLSVADIFELPQEKINFTVQSEDIFRLMGTENGVKEGRVQLWCPVNPFGNVDVPAEWYEQVKGNQWSGQQQHGFGSMTRFPKQIKGFIYINGLEYEADGEGQIKATGHKLLTKEEFKAIQPKA